MRSLSVREYEEKSLLRREDKKKKKRIIRIDILSTFFEDQI